MHHGGAEVPAPADAIVANMTVDELRQALPAIRPLWHGAGQFVVSGRRAHKAPPFLALWTEPTAGTIERAPFTALAWLLAR